MGHGLSHNVTDCPDVTIWMDTKTFRKSDTVTDSSFGVPESIPGHSSGKSVSSTGLRLH